jgi:hypothetical protein
MATTPIRSAADPSILWQQENEWCDSLPWTIVNVVDVNVSCFAACRCFCMWRDQFRQPLVHRTTDGAEWADLFLQPLHSQVSDLFCHRVKW